ncbi:MAG: metallophosphoesterase [Tannerella sp.]|jgi:hypothetical protein|nr:metallophosphoesterase [Tannerella sp.]
MKRSIYYITLFNLLCVALSAKDTSIKLAFNEKGLFKIAQFTDLHWSHTSPGCAKTTATIQYVLETEKPDLAVLTGDVVTDAPAREAWLTIAKLFEDAKMPFAVTLGNHDAEAGISRKEIFKLLENLPYFVGEEGPEDIQGSGNYVLPIAGKQSEAAALIYCFDSNDYPAQTKYGYYDWVHLNQIEWYRKQSRQYASANNNAALPALAFFHIPLLEYNNVVGQSTTIGTKGEGIASADINTGLFASMIEMKDIMGAFVGHDHDNDYIGITYDIALAFGRVTGTDPYGRLERGARIIELHEDKFKFDTWIRTPEAKEWVYYYPSGLSATDENEMDYLPALPVKPVKQGVSYTCYEGAFKHTSQMTNDKIVKQGVMEEITIKDAPAEDHFGYQFRTWIQIPERGVYRFYTFSDDGSKLLVDGQEIVDNDGSHSSQRKDGKVALEAGFHELKLLYFEDYMGQVLEVGFSGKDIRETTLPAHLLFVPED